MPQDNRAPIPPTNYLPPRVTEPAWISVDSFAPGIYEDYAAASLGGMTNIINGAATRSGTYRCVADPISGMLSPLPLAVAGQAQALIGTATSSFYPANNIAMYVGDAVVSSPVGTASTFPTSDPDAVAILWGFVYDNDGGSNGYRPYILGREYRIFSSGTRDFAFEKGAANVTPPIPLSAMGLDRGLFRTGTGFGIGATDAPALFMLHPIGIGGPTAGVIPAGDTPLTTYDTDVSANFRALTSAVGRYTNTDSIFTTFTCDGLLLIAHQGRYIACGLRFPHYGDFYSASVSQGVDAITYSASGTYAGGTQAVYMEENQTGFGAVASLSADQLFIVKHYGGGYIIRGSLSAPVVQRLPFIQSTEGVVSRPARTPIGVVYGTRNGIHLFKGGDSSEPLSPQLDGDFWRVKNDLVNEKYEGIESRFEWWNPYVCVGNNWLYDTRNKSWWRLDDPASFSSRPFSHYAMSAASGKLYAFPYKVTAAATTAWYTFDRSVLALSYRWTSQPLVETRDEFLRYEEVEIVAMRPAAATGACTVTVTLTGINHLGATIMATPVVFDLSTITADRPAILRKNIAGAGSTTAFSARYLQIQIDSSANAGSAPKVGPPRVFVRKTNSTPNV